MQRRTFLTASLGALACATLPRLGVAQGTPGATPPPALTTLYGPALSLIPAGEPNTVAVVLTGAPMGVNVPIVVKNTTPGEVQIDTISAIARDGAGTMIAVATGAALAPYTLPPNAVAIGGVSFPYGTALPPDATFEFTIDPIDVGQALIAHEMPVLEVGPTPTGLVGRAKNTTTVPLSFPKVTVTWFDPATGQITGGAQDYVVEQEVAPDGIATFNATFAGTAMTDFFLVGVVGWDYS